MTQKLLSDLELRRKLVNINDSRFIDVLDTLMGFEFGMTATEWIEHKYRQGGTGTVEFINNL